jgi:hypothetical protein
VGAIIENLEELEQPPVIRNGRLAIRLFADTLPTFDFAAPDYIGLVHFDADLYTVRPQQTSAMWGRICGQAATWCSTSGTASTAPGRCA